MSNTDDPTCVIKMLNEFRSCNPTMNLPNLIDSRSITMVPTKLQFDDSVVSNDNKKRKFTDIVSVGTAEVSTDSDLSVVGKLTNTLPVCLYIASRAEVQNLVIRREVMI